MIIKNKNITNNFGYVPIENHKINRPRVHQGWWRSQVLNQPPGKHPVDPSKNLCNTILNGEHSGSNFLSKNAFKIVKDTFANRNQSGMGIVEEERLFNNLLSSQPLCFNFFSELSKDKPFGLNVLKSWWSELTELNDVYFEYAPIEKYTNDNSAFDVAFEVSIENQRGLIGLECKYTDSFSKKEYDKPAYREIFDKSKAFQGKYNEFVAEKYNQLFRNQLIAESLIQNNKYDFVRTGLFCYENDEEAINTGKEFSSMLSLSNTFQVITYRDFIENTQQRSLDWEKREWTMLLWARYCATALSENIYRSLKSKV